MKRKDLSIGMQLGIGLGIILALVILLGVVVVIQEASLWEETAGLYEHPLQVRRAIGDLDTDILIMQKGMKDLVLADNDLEMTENIQLIDTKEADAYKQFDILYSLYLGPRSDIDTSFNNFVQWKSNRDETIRLLRAGNVTEAEKRIKEMMKYFALSQRNEWYEVSLDVAIVRLQEQVEDFRGQMKY